MFRGVRGEDCDISVSYGSILGGGGILFSFLFWSFSGFLGSLVGRELGILRGGVFYGAC